jgi:formate--tetrahydrofolate ligase
MEKFFNIKCRYSGLRPDAAVLVATIRALKLHTGKYRVVPGKPLPPEMLVENPDDVHVGASNLRKQVENLLKHGVSPVICINHFSSDHPSETGAVFAVAKELGVRCALSEHWARGGAGAVELARVVVEAAEEPTSFNFLYELDQPVKAKIETIAREIYGAAKVDYESAANNQIRQIERSGFGALPICMAKTHLSLSDDPSLKGAPRDFTLTIREVRASVGAGFIYPLVGEMRTMPGLPSHPAAENVDIDFETGRVVGLF